MKYRKILLFTLLIIKKKILFLKKGVKILIKKIVNVR